MPMFEPRADEEFEPSINVKNLWTYTRKLSYNAAGIKLPGLFITKGFETDTAAFVTVIFLEAWGLYNLIAAIGGNGRGGLNAFGIAVIFVLFLIDITLAILRHIPLGRECHNSNELVLVKTLAGRQRLSNASRRMRFLRPLLSVLIIAAAVVKLFLFNHLQKHVTGISVSILVSYMLAAMLHIYNTGYFLYGIVFSNRMKKEYNIWASGSGGANSLTIGDYRPFPIVVPDGERIDISAVTVDRHRIEYLPTYNCFVLRTWGVLTDGQLQTLVGRQRTATAGALVAQVGLQAQLTILKSPPIGAQVADGLGVHQLGPTRVPPH